MACDNFRRASRCYFNTFLFFIPHRFRDVQPDFGFNALKS
jgi:hypothetical protein